MEWGYSLLQFLSFPTSVLPRLSFSAGVTFAVTVSLGTGSFVDVDTSSSPHCSLKDASFIFFHFFFFIMFISLGRVKISEFTEICCGRMLSRYCNNFAWGRICRLI
uniref:Uncharacterized protein n=1 Tax=Wuchereria bancrofti TaxID=6293 RepID=A0A1I8EV94_WUCBA